MKLFAFVCAIICTLTTVITCSLISASPNVIRGDDKSISIASEKKDILYTLVLENFQFRKSEEAKIHVIPIPTTQSARIEAIYSAELDNYGFIAEIQNNIIRLSMESDSPHPIKMFNIVVYAPVAQVQASGSGYRLLIDNPLYENFSLYLGGDIQTTFSTNDNSSFTLGSAGSSVVDVSGNVAFANIAISGSSKMFAKNLVCDSANVSISGSGMIQVSVNDSLQANIKGNSVLEYWGSPKVVSDVVELNSVLTQISQTAPSNMRF